MTFTPAHLPQTHSETFGDLPDALIHELLSRADEVSRQARFSVDARIEERVELRSRAQQLRLVSKVDNITDPSLKTVAAVDGSIALIRLAAFELTGAAALAVDGIGNSESVGELPYEFEIHITDPIALAREVSYGLMFCLEYEVATNVNRDLVMLDGTFFSGMVAISLALRSAGDLRDDLSEAFKRRWTDTAMELVPKILDSDNIIAIPKRSAANEFVRQTKLFGGREVDFNGRATDGLEARIPAEFCRSITTRKLTVSICSTPDWDRDYKG